MSLATLATALLAIFGYGPSTSPPDDFDMFLLVREWNQGENTFTIHGLWGDRSDGSWPAFCSRRKMALADIQDLLPRMRKEWPSNRGDDFAFWQHEYVAHGTCTTMTPHDYFEATLTLHDRYDLMEALKDDPRTPLNIVADVREAWGVTPLVHPSEGEVWMCFTKSLEPMECGPHVRARLGATYV